MPWHYWAIILLWPLFSVNMTSYNCGIVGLDFVTFILNSKTTGVILLISIVVTHIGILSGRFKNKLIIDNVKWPSGE